MNKWLEVYRNGFDEGYVAADDAKMFTIESTSDTIQILMWVDYDIDNCIVVHEINCEGRDGKMYLELLDDAKLCLAQIIYYISDGEMCTYSEYRQHKDVYYGSCTATNHSNKRKRGEKQCVNIDPSV